MKGKINRAGFLKLKRGIEYKVQCCKNIEKSIAGIIVYLLKSLKILLI